MYVGQMKAGCAKSTGDIQQVTLFLGCSHLTVVNCVLVLAIITSHVAFILHGIRVPFPLPWDFQACNLDQHDHALHLRHQLPDPQCEVVAALLSVHPFQSSKWNHGVLHCSLAVDLPLPEYWARLGPCTWFLQPSCWTRADR